MLSWQRVNWRQSLGSSPRRRKARFRLAPPNPLSHRFYRYPSLLVVAFPTETEPVWTCSQHDSLLQFDGKNTREERTEVPVRRIPAGFFLHRNVVLGALKVKWLLCIWRQVGSWGQPVDNWASHSSKSYGTCPLSAGLWTCAAGNRARGEVTRPVRHTGGSRAAQRVNVARPWGKSSLAWVEIMSRWQIDASLQCGSLQGPSDSSQPHTTNFKAHSPAGSQRGMQRGQDWHKVSVTTYTLAEPTCWSRRAGIAIPPMQNCSSCFHTL